MMNRLRVPRASSAAALAAPQAASHVEAASYTTSKTNDSTADHDFAPDPLRAELRLPDAGVAARPGRR